MSETFQKIQEGVKLALKSGERERADLLRFLIAQINNRQIEKRGSGTPELSEDDVIEVLRKEVKKRGDSIELFRKGGREDLAGKEEREVSMVSEFLPPPPSEEDIRTFIRSLKGSGNADFPSVMKETMAKFRGADGKAVSGMVREELG